MQAMLLVRLIAISLLVFMALCQQSWSHRAVIIPIYILRFALANCTYALSKSILNDYVPKVIPLAPAHCSCRALLPSWPAFAPGRTSPVPQ